MAFGITVGYDFTVNEIPTRAKLTAMVAGISLSGISRTSIDATLINAVYGDSGTSIPAEGWMWVDRIGNLWGQTRWGLAHIRRVGGGMSTRRFTTNVVLDSYSLPFQNAAGRGFILNRLQASGDTNESNVHFHLSNDQRSPPSLRNEETAVSGIHTRWILRGTATVPETTVAGQRSFPDLLKGNDTAGQQLYEDVVIPSPVGDASAIFFGLGRKAGTSSQANGWLYGMGVKLL